MVPSLTYPAALARVLLLFLCDVCTLLLGHLPILAALSTLAPVSGHPPALALLRGGPGYLPSCTTDPRPEPQAETLLHGLEAFKCLPPLSFLCTLALMAM